MRLIIILLLFLALIFQLCSKREDRVRTVVLTDAAPAPIGPYSQAILNHKRLYVSGQIGIIPGAELDSSSIENETRQCLKNIQTIVEAAGLQLKDVSKTSIFLTDLSNFAKVNAVYAEFFGADPPARETLEVRALPKKAHIEISAIVN